MPTLTPGALHTLLVPARRNTLITGTPVGDQPDHHTMVGVPHDGVRIRLTNGDQGTCFSLIETIGHYTRIRWKSLSDSGYIVSNDNQHNELKVREDSPIELTWSTNCGNAAKDVEVTLKVKFLPSTGKIEISFTTQGKK